MYTLEICANGFASAKAAALGGASRVELCDNMAEGGTTPSYGQIRQCKTLLDIEIWPIIRPRGGDFLYSEEEFKCMQLDIELCKSVGCEGVVTGILTAEGHIDEARCATLIALAYPMPVAFHRAFDMCREPLEALEVLIRLGFKRVLSSGGQLNAYEGRVALAQLVEKANQRIEIMPGAGIQPGNIDFIRLTTGARTFHASARTAIASKMLYKNPHSKMGDSEKEYEYDQSNEQIIRQLVNQLNSHE